MVVFHKIHWNKCHSERSVAEGVQSKRSEESLKPNNYQAKQDAWDSSLRSE